RSSKKIVPSVAPVAVPICHAKSIEHALLPELLACIAMCTPVSVNGAGIGAPGRPPVSANSIGTRQPPALVATGTCAATPVSVPSQPGSRGGAYYSRRHAAPSHGRTTAQCASGARRGGDAHATAGTSGPAGAGGASGAAPANGPVGTRSTCQASPPLAIAPC